MQITILNVSIQTVPTAKGSYQVADVAYKNNSFGGKVEGKKVMSFGATKEAFGVLSTAQPGDTFEVNVVKNDKGFNDWVSMQKAGAAAPQAAAASGTPGVQRGSTASPAPRSGYETPEERAAKQAIISRQSAINSAIATLAVGAKKLEPAEVLKVAQEYNDWAFQRKSPGASGFEDFPDVPDFVSAPTVD